MQVTEVCLYPCLTFLLCVAIFFPKTEECDKEFISSVAMEVMNSRLEYLNLLLLRQLLKKKVK